MSDIDRREKIVFFINPISGTKKKDNFPDRILKLVDSSRFDAEIYITKHKGDAADVVKQKLDDGYRRFVAVGGDGTVNEIATALVDTEGILGIIPIGSGNGLARHLKIPLNLEKSMELINSGKYDSIDYGRINGLPFFSTCGVGFDAHIGFKFAEATSRGFMTYLKTTLKEYFNYKPKKYRLKINGEQKLKTRAFLITVANASQYGNNAYISPKSDVQDGELEICVLAPFKKYRSVEIGIRLFAKTMDKSPKMTTIKAENIVLKRKRPGVVHFDGEPCMMGRKLKIRIVPKGLKVMVAY